MDSKYKIPATLDEITNFSLSQLLTRISRLFRHRMNNPIIKAHFEIENLSEHLAKGDPKTEEYVNHFREIIDEIADLSTQFAESLPSFIRSEPISIKSCIERAVGYFTKSLENDDNIRFDITCDSRLIVYASPLLTEHLYNLIDNSIYAIRQALQAGKIENGLINIEGKQEKSNDKSPLVIIRLLDNGGGIPPDIEDQVFTIGFTTKQYGSGFGLVAAQQYFRSINGTIALENIHGSGVAITIALPEYCPDSHKANNQ